MSPLRACALRLCARARASTIVLHAPAIASGVRGAAHSVGVTTTSAPATTSSSTTTLTTNSFGSPLPAVLEASGWDGAWLARVTPWETRASHPAIRALQFRDARLPAQLPAGLPAAGAVLVAGCGSGRDALAWASGGRAVVGLDLSPAAIAEARRVEAAGAGGGCGRSAGSVQWRAGDFFGPAAGADGSYAIAFDYTFLGALPPSERGRALARFRALLAPGGALVVVAFPTFGPRPGEGPPFVMDVLDVAAEARAAGLVLAGGGELPPVFCARAREGREALLVFVKADD